MAHKNERVELEMKIMKYRALARQAAKYLERQANNRSSSSKAA